MEKKKFYKTTWFLIVLGIFLPVIAIVLLWLVQKERSQKQKIVFTAIFAVWALLGFLSNSINKNKSPKVEQPSPSVVETTIQEETETNSESNEEQGTEVESNGETADSLRAMLKEKYDVGEPQAMENDATGKWRIVEVSNSTPTSEYAVDYAKAYMTESEMVDIHYIINSNLKTTTKLQVIVGKLEVKTTEYVANEEKDARTIGDGEVLSEQCFDLETGEEIKAEADPNAGTVDTDTLVTAVKDAVDGEVGANEKITGVSMQEKNLIITVDLSGADTKYLSTRDIALSRISSITDAILELDDSYYNTWETITLDFGSDGTAVLNKGMVKDQGFGKFFDFKDEILKDKTNAEITVTESSTTTVNNDFITGHETDIVVSAKMALDNFLSDYKMSLAPQNWVIAKFDESETTVIAMTDITYNGQKGRYIYVGTLNLNASGKVESAKPHYLEVNGSVLGNDGYCDDVFEKIKSLTQ